MNEQIEKHLREVSDSGYASYDAVCAEYEDWMAKYAVTHADFSEEKRQVQVINLLKGKTPKTHDLKGYFIGVAGEFDQNKKARDAAVASGVVNEEGEPIDANDKTIPSEADSLVRVCYFFGTQAKEGVEENWKPSTVWNRTGVAPELMVQTEFKGTGNLDKAIPAIGAPSGIKFNVTSKEPINFVEMVQSSIPENVCGFEDIASFEQPKAFPVMVFRAQVVRATTTREGVPNNPVELRMPAETVEDLAKADNMENVTVWCDKAVPLNFGEGDIVWCVGNKYVKNDGSLNLKGFGFFVESSAYPENKPEELNDQNGKATVAPQTSTITAIDEEIQQQAFVEEELKQAIPKGGDGSGASEGVEPASPKPAK